MVISLDAIAASATVTAPDNGPSTAQAPSSAADANGSFGDHLQRAYQQPANSTAATDSPQTNSSTNSSNSSQDAAATNQADASASSAATSSSSSAKSSAGDTSEADGKPSSATEQASGATGTQGDKPATNNHDAQSTAQKPTSGVNVTAATVAAVTQAADDKKNSDADDHHDDAQKLIVAVVAVVQQVPVETKAPTTDTAGGKATLPGATATDATGGKGPKMPVGNQPAGGTTAAQLASAVPSPGATQTTETASANQPPPADPARVVSAGLADSALGSQTISSAQQGSASGQAGAQALANQIVATLANPGGAAVTTVVDTAVVTGSNAATVTSKSDKSGADNKIGETQPGPIGGTNNSTNLMGAATPSPSERFSSAFGTTTVGLSDSAGGTSQADRVRFVQRVARAFQSIGENGSPIRLRLSPPELGSLKLEIKVDQGQMTAKVEAETPAARAMLLDNLPALRDRLQEQDITVTRFDVDLAGQSSGGLPQTPDRNQGDGGWSRQSNGGQNNGNSSESTPLAPLTSSTTTGPIDGRLNVII